VGTVPGPRRSPRPELTRARPPSGGVGVVAARSEGARRLRLWGVGLPVALVVALQLLGWLVLRPWLGANAACAVVGGLTVVGLVGFALTIWRVLERAEERMVAAIEAGRRNERQLVALHEAALSITSALDLQTVLQRIVDESRNVIGTRYGALAALGEDGTIDQFITAGLDPQTIAALGAPPTGHGLLGLVITQQRTLRVPDIGAHPHSVGFPPHHPPMRRLLAVPLFSQGAVVGSLYVTDRVDGRAFDLADEQTLERFAAQAATAVVNARLYGEVQHLSLVEERERIGMDLHDGVLQALYATGLGLETAIEDVEAAPAEARAAIERAIVRLHATIADIRHYIFDLRAMRAQGTEGLAAALRQLLDGLRQAGVSLELRTPEQLPELSKRSQWECWHIAREAVSNALRHGRCSGVTVVLDTDGPQFRMRIIDDGQGFAADSPRGQEHRGLRNMVRRAEGAGGTLTVSSGPGEGTVVTLSLPVAPPG